jgi:hypothetical protein
VGGIAEVSALRFLGATALLTLLGAAHAPAQTAFTHIYTDAKRGFSISYPDGWTVDPAYRDKGYGFFQGESDDYREAVALKPTIDLAPGTTLQSDQLVLMIETARPGDTCEARAFLVDPPPDYVTQTPEIKPDAVRSIAQAGDLYTIEHIVLLATKTPCIAAHYIIVTRRISGNDPAAPKPFSEKALFAYLNDIAATLRLAK